MKRLKVFLLTLLVTTPLLYCHAAEFDLPIRGLHCSVPRADDLPLCTKFIREALPEEGVNVLVIEFNYGYEYQSYPELSSGSALSKEEVKQLVSACNDAGVQLIPQINCLGHQSWSSHNGLLLQKFPQFDETPDKYPQNKGIYCRSYCPLHPDVHKVIFALIDELADVCEADAFHVGMDEVFIVGDEDCPRCGGKDKAELFAGEVKRLHDHLAEKNRRMWIWGDRFLDGEVTQIGKWEASMNDTAPAINMIPKDIVICDWHYEWAPPTAAYFAIKGFDVVSSPWRKAEVALGQLEQMRIVRDNSKRAIKERMKGMLHTTWCGMTPFVKAYYGDENVKDNEAAMESANCFKKLFAAIRNE